MTPEICPNCGADVPPNAKACPECGSCEETGWSEAAETGGLDLPEEEFDYDDFVKKEFGEEKPKPRGISWLWWVVGIALLAILLGLFFLR
jgi:hypothetical protein